MIIICKYAVIDSFLNSFVTLNYGNGAIFIIFAFKLNKSRMMEDINRIKVVLCEKNLTGKWLAEKLQVNPTTVSKWCTNTSQPDLYTLKKVAELVGVPIAELLR